MQTQLVVQSLRSELKHHPWGNRVSPWGVLRKTGNQPGPPEWSIHCYANGLWAGVNTRFSAITSFLSSFGCLWLYHRQEPSSVQFSHSVMSDSLRPHESQHTRPPCPSPTPGVHSDSRPSSQRCHPAISSSVVPFSSCPQSLPASESFPMSQLFAWGGQSTGLRQKSRLSFWP